MQKRNAEPDPTLQTGCMCVGFVCTKHHHAISATSCSNLVTIGHLSVVIDRCNHLIVVALTVSCLACLTKKHQIPWGQKTPGTIVKHQASTGMSCLQLQPNKHICCWKHDTIQRAFQQVASKPKREAPLVCIGNSPWRNESLQQLCMLLHVMQARVWWEPTKDEERTDYSGAWVRG